MVSLREREREREGERERGRGKKDKKGKCEVTKHDSQNDKTTSAHTENNMKLRENIMERKRREEQR